MLPGIIHIFLYQLSFLHKIGIIIEYFALCSKAVNCHRGHYFHFYHFFTLIFRNRTSCRNSSDVQIDEALCEGPMTPPFRQKMSQL